MDVGSNLAGVALERFLADGVIGGFERVEIPIHRGFGIHHDGFAAGQPHDQVGPQALAFVGGGGVLGFKIAMLLHAGEFHDPPQLHFPPLAAADRLAQRLDQRGGFALQADLAFAERADLFLELGVGPFAGFFDVADAQLEFAERFGHRLDQRLDGGLALLDVALGFFGLGGQRGFRELQELFGRGAQRVGGEGFERVGELDFGAFEQRLFVGGGFEFGFEAGAQFGELVAECLGVLLVAFGIGGGMGQADFDLPGAAFLGLEPLTARGDLAGGGQAGQQPANQQPDQDGDDLRQVEGEGGWNHVGFRLRVAGCSVCYERRLSRCPSGESDDKQTKLP